MGETSPGWQIYVRAARAISTLERRPVLCSLQDVRDVGLHRPW
jgi:hypothetical protein